MLMQDHINATPARNGFSLRRREIRDADALFEIFSQPRCRLAMVLEPFSSADEVQAWFDNLGPGAFEIVAVLDDRPIGFAGLYPFPGSQSHSGWMCLFIQDAFDRRGIGTMMMQAIVATSDQLAGLSRIQLTVFCDNDRAISLYRKFGFEIEGRHPCFARRGDLFLGAFTMARIVAPAKPFDISRICEASGSDFNAAERR